MDSDLLRLVDVAGAPALAVDTGLNPAQAARAGVARLLGDRGTILRPDGSAESWTASGAVEIDGRLFAHGNPFPGRTLEALIRDDADAALAVVRRLCAAERLPSPFVPAATLVSADGAVLLLPGQLCARRIESLGGEASRIGRWNHPDYSGAPAVAFSCAAAAYAVLCGAPPFAAADAEALAADIRDGRALPARFARPGLDPALAAALDRALGIGSDGGRGAAGALSPGELRAAFGAAVSARDLSRPLSAEEAARLESEKARLSARSERRIGRRRFLRRKGTRLAAAAAGLLAVAAVVWSVVDGRADRFTTAGLGARETVETYYAAFNALETEKMEACVLPSAAKADIDAATNLFVIFRVRQAYERVSGWVPADNWEAEGFPETDRAVFGLAGLDIANVGAENEYLVSYRFYAPGGNAEARTDRVVLERVKGAWRIARLEREAVPAERR